LSKTGNRARKRAQFFTLSTTSFLLPALNLYRSLGFLKTGYGDLCGTSLIKMEKILILSPTGKSINNEYSK
jgi:hypothetical protein